jgi:hypothetical protein
MAFTQAMRAELERSRAEFAKLEKITHLELYKVGFNLKTPEQVCELLQAKTEELYNYCFKNWNVAREDVALIRLEFDSSFGYIRALLVAYKLKVGYK